MSTIKINNKSLGSLMRFLYKCSIGYTIVLLATFLSSCYDKNGLSYLKKVEAGQHAICTKIAHLAGRREKAYLRVEASTVEQQSVQEQANKQEIKDALLLIGNVCEQLQQLQQGQVELGDQIKGLAHANTATLNRSNVHIVVAEREKKFVKLLHGMMAEMKKMIDGLCAAPEALKRSDLRTVVVEIQQRLSRELTTTVVEMKQMIDPLLQARVIPGAEKVDQNQHVQNQGRVDKGLTKLLSMGEEVADRLACLCLIFDNQHFSASDSGYQPENDSRPLANSSKIVIESADYKKEKIELEKEKIALAAQLVEKECALENSAKQLQEWLTSSEEEKEALKEALARTGEQIDLLARKNSALQAELKQMKQLSKGQGQKIDELEIALTCKDQEICALGQLNERLQGYLRTSEEDKEVSKKELAQISEQIDALDEAVKCKNQEICRLKGLNEQLKGSLNSSKKENEVSKEALACVQDQIDALRQKNSMLQKELEQIENESAERSRKIDALEEELDNAGQENKKIINRRYSAPR